MIAVRFHTNREEHVVSLRQVVDRDTVRYELLRGPRLVQTVGVVSGVRECPSRVSQLAGRSAAAAHPARRSKTTQNVRLMSGPSLPQDESKVRAMTQAGAKSDTSTGTP